MKASLLILTCLGLTATVFATTQTDLQESILARAFLMEEIGNDVEGALGLYDQIVKLPDVTDSMEARAAVGRARCLRKSGRYEESLAVMAAIRSEGLGRGLLDELQLERERLDAARGAQDSDQDPVEVLVNRLLLKGDWSEIRDLGRPAIAPLLKVIDGPVAAELSTGPVVQTAITALVQMRLPETPGVMVGILERGKLVERHRLLEALMQGPGQSKRGNDLSVEYAPVVVAGLNDSDSLTRMRAASLLDDVSLTDWSQWSKALTDSQAKVRESAFQALIRRNALSSDRLIEGCRIVAKDESPELRSAVAKALHRVREVDLEAAEGLFERLLKDPAPEVRRAAIGFAYQLAPSLVRDAVTPALADVDSEVRVAAIDSLGRLNDVADVDVLLPLLADPSPLVRERAASFLSRASAESLLAGVGREAFFIDRLQDSEPRVRSFAMSVLARAGTKAAREPLLALAERVTSQDAASLVYYVVRQDLADDSSRILSSIISGPWQQQLTLPHTPQNFRTGLTPYGHSLNLSMVLEWLGRRGHHDQLLDALNRFEEFPSAFDSDVARIVGNYLTDADRQAYVRILERFNDKERLARVVSSSRTFLGAAPEALALYRKGLSSPSDGMRAASARALGDVGPSTIVPELIDRLAIEADDDVKSSLVRAISKRAQEQHLALLESGLRAADGPALRKSFVQTIGRIGLPRATGLLLTLLDEGGFDREAIFDQLASNLEPRGFDAIMKALEDEGLSDRERESAILALGRYRRPEAWPRLLEAMIKDPGQRTRDPRFSYTALDRNQRTNAYFHPAIIAMHDLGPDVLIPEVERLLAEGAPEAVMDDLVEILAFVPDEGATQLIIKTFGHASSAVRSAAAHAAGEALLPEAIPGLRLLVRSANDELRRAAEDALLRMVAFGVSP
ncbi:MAG: HEAT repeat domain-containing protein [Planctomycetes bacterium]|nr:HEAT repeat domain-containing protein [Planctomycetota bacterium]